MERQLYITITLEIIITVIALLMSLTKTTTK